MYNIVRWREGAVMALVVAERSAGVDRVDPAVVLPGIFKLLGDEWQLNNEQQMQLLGLSSRQTLANWRRAPGAATLTRDLQERLSYLLGIYKSLRILFPDPAMARRWLFTPNANKAFAGDTPMQRMLYGLVVDLAFVRQFLDYERGP